MSLILQLSSYLCVLIASIMLGNWFLSEMRRAKRSRRPWYSVYLSIPGLLIITVIALLPVYIRFFK